MLQGKKTYIASIGVIVAAIAGFITGEASLVETITASLTGLGLATLRLGVKEDSGGGQ